MLPSIESIAARLRLKQLRLLVELDKHGSLHKTAEVMAISQPGASKALHEIELILGMRLFDRQPKGLTANDLGRCAIRYARLIYSDLAHLREDMLGITQGHGGRLSVGVIMGAVPLLTRSLSRLRHKQPTLSVEIVENTSAHLLTLLDEGRLDLAICRIGVSTRPTTYDCVTLNHEPLSVVATHAHPLAAAKSLSIKELSQYRWVVYPANMPMRQALEHELSEAGLEVPRYPLETSSTFVTLMMLQEDPLLVAVTPREVAEFGEKLGLLQQLPVSLRALIEPYGAISRIGSDLTPAARLLIEEMQEQILATAPP